MHHIFVFLFLAFLVLPFSAARAGDSAPDCLREYETAILGTWQIASDVLRFKTMFDNYDRLCTQYYPDDMAALKETGDILRAQTDADVKNAEKVVHIAFDEYLPSRVAPSCADNKRARDKVRKNVLKAMKTQSKTVGARLEKSAMTLRNPGADLKLCRDLKPLEKKVRKAIGNDFRNPLFEMSLANSRFMTRDEKRRKDDFALYRSILNSLEAPEKN